MAALPTPSPAPRTRWRRGFWALIATQFQGAFSDNALKNLVILLILGTGISQAQKDRLVPCVLLLFAAPFLLFSMAGGYLADRFSKRTVTINTKFFELAVAALAFVGLAASNLPLQFSAIFLLSASAAVFGPAKYGLLPELLPPDKLSWGNGVLELGTFLAIITGTIAAGYMSEDFHDRQYLSGLVLLALILPGIAASFGISRVPAWNPARPFRVNFLADLFEIRGARSDRKLYAALWANTFFWFLGGLLQPIILLYGKEALLLSDAHNTWLQASLAVGIGLGSLVAAFFPAEKSNTDWCPWARWALPRFTFRSPSPASASPPLPRASLSRASSRAFSPFPSMPCSSIALTLRAKARCWQRQTFCLSWESFLRGWPITRWSACCIFRRSAFFSLADFSVLWLLCICGSACRIPSSACFSGLLHIPCIAFASPAANFYPSAAA